MGSRKSLEELGWKIVSSKPGSVRFEKWAGGTVFVEFSSKEVIWTSDVGRLTFAELSAILDFIKEDAIY